MHGVVYSKPKAGRLVFFCPCLVVREDTTAETEKISSHGLEDVQRGVWDNTAAQLHLDCEGPKVFDSEVLLA